MASSGLWNKVHQAEHNAEVTLKPHTVSGHWKPLYLSVSLPLITLPFLKDRLCCALLDQLKARNDGNFAHFAVLLQPCAQITPSSSIGYPISAFSFRLWSKHDDDGSGTISGGETVAFMDDLTDLLLQT